MGRNHPWEKQLPGDALKHDQGSWEVKAQIKRKCRNAYEEREDSGGKDELITLIPAKSY